ncbi:MAG TPA: DedA family protein [Kofleriaceae bacterium]|jgi:membrane protein DedA with SNARE-associated domain|nr:DedA family protein [Kofleriaceae bacterium]
MEAFLGRWGYLAVFVGTFFEGETVALAGGTLAHHGLLHWSLVATCAFVGTVLCDQIWFVVGRHLGTRVIARVPRWHEPLSKVRARFAQRGDAFVIGFRFVLGLRTLTPFFLGSSAYSHARFTVLNAIGGAIWAVAFTALGWLVGEGVTRLLGRFARVEEILAAAAALAVATWLATRLGKSRRRRPIADATTSPQP